MSGQGALFLLISAAGLFGSSAIVRAVRRWALARGVLDRPNARSSHTVPTPRGGGWGIAVPVLLLLLLWPLTGLDAHAARALGVAAGAALIVAVSWRDDLRPVGSGARLAVHVLAACVAVTAITWRAAGAAAGQPELSWVALLLAVVWIVGLANAYNFMDGIDGLAGGQAVLAGVGWLAIGWLAHLPLVAALGAMVAAASAGFLGLNWPPARIFLGDVGSVLLGYTCAILPLLAAAGPGGLPVREAPLLGVLLVWPFVFDSLFTFLRRLRAGENVLAAHRSHLYQRLTRTGRSHRFVTALYLGLAAIGLVAAVLRTMHHPAAAGATVAVPVAAFWLWRFVVSREKSQQPEAAVHRSN